MQTIRILLLCLMLSGCSNAASPSETTVPNAETALQIANPRKDYDSLEEAEAASGLDFPLPEMIADSYMAETFRIMSGQLLEVHYRHETLEVIVRMQAGEEQDLSGVYGEFENEQAYHEDGASITVRNIGSSVLQLISKDGYSYSLYAPNGYWGDSNIEFLHYIYDVW